MAQWGGNDSWKTRRGIFVFTAATVIVSACANTPSAFDQNAPAASTSVALMAPEKLRIVDCLLPQELRQLGSRFTYLAQRRPIKTSALDCEVQGGEYVRQDRASYLTALAIWQEQADGGDPQAQTYVGEIFEKGLGRAPDYATAAQWYLKAADSGYRPAQLALGRLYEQGLGVEKDLVVALNWYRRASGLENENIGFTAAFEQAAASNRRQIERLTADLGSERQRADRYEQQLRQLERERDESVRRQGTLRRDVEKLQRDLNGARRELNDAARRERSRVEAAPALPSASPAALEQARQQEQSQRLVIEKLQEELAAARQAVTEKAQQASNESVRSAALEQRLQQLQQQSNTAEAALRATEQEMAAKAKEVSSLQATLGTLTANLQSAAGNSAKVEELGRQLQQVNQQLEQERQAKVAMEQAAARQTQELKKLRQQVDTANGERLLTEKSASQTGQRLAVKDSRIDGLEQQLAKAQAELQARARQAEELAKRLGQSEQSYSARVTALEQDLSSKQQLLAQEEAQAKTLREDLGKLRSEHATVAGRLAEVAPDAPPSINVRWPKLEAAKGGGKEVAQVGAGATVHVVAAVFPAPEIARVEMNGQAQALDRNGLFLADLTVNAEPLSVRIKAVDRKGRETLTEFSLAPVTEGPLAMRGGGGLTVPRVDFGRYHAILIGNDQYESGSGWNPLSTAVKGAESLAEVLRTQYGFTTKVLRNAKKEEILLALEAMRKNLTTQDNLLIYYAGHGHLDPENEVGYWIPVDGRKDSFVKWVANSEITDQIRAMNAKKVMVIADSCYSATLTRSSINALRSAQTPEQRIKGLKESATATSRLVLTAGGLQPVLDTGGAGFSVFTRALVDVLRGNNELLDGDTLSTSVGSRVAVASSLSTKQQPQYAPLARGGHAGGDFYFIPVNWKGGI